ncbi:hypothetical protein DSECCO2_166530 [anaerobic digester metagenome]
MSKVYDLVKDCDSLAKKPFRMFFWSFDLDFSKVHRHIDDTFSRKTYDPDELKQFIEICDNRINLYTTLLTDVSVVLGFGFVALSVVTTLVASGLTYVKPLDILTFNAEDVALSGLLWTVILLVIALFCLMVTLRKKVYLWTGFKERAILSK